MTDLFISYARRDADIVYPIIHGLERRGLSVWYDAANLKAGEVWELSIESALRQAKVVVVFVSAHPSEWVFQELLYALENQIRVIPVLLPGGSFRDVPPPLHLYQFLDLSAEPAMALTATAVREIEKVFRDVERDASQRSLRPDEIAGFAHAAGLQATERAPAVPGHPTSIFVVHGHDEDMLTEVCAFANENAIEPIVLRDMDSGSSSLLDRFFEIGGKATHALVLLSGDDFGAPVSQYELEGVGDRALQFRARQNVILELGYFYGLLGWDKVYVLERAPKRPFPNFERPSDLGGKVFNRFDAEGRWKTKLAIHLKQSGFLFP